MTRMNNLELWILRSNLNRKSIFHGQRNEALLCYLESLKGKRLTQEKINGLVKEFLSQDKKRRALTWSK